jgi:hypothetical protein
MAKWRTFAAKATVFFSEICECLGVISLPAVAGRIQLCFANAFLATICPDDFFKQGTTEVFRYMSSEDGLLAKGKR